MRCGELINSKWEKKRKLKWEGKGEQSHIKEHITGHSGAKKIGAIKEPRKWELTGVQKVVQKERTKVWLLFKLSPIIGILSAPF